MGGGRKGAGGMDPEMIKAMMKKYKHDAE